MMEAARNVERALMIGGFVRMCGQVPRADLVQMLRAVTTQSEADRAIALLIRVGFVYELDGLLVWFTYEIGGNDER